MGARKFNSQYSLGFVDALHELVWIWDRTLASKNMNAHSQTIFWDKIDIKNNSDVTWLFNWCKKKNPTIFLISFMGQYNNLQKAMNQNQSFSPWKNSWN